MNNIFSIKLRIFTLLFFAIFIRVTAQDNTDCVASLKKAGKEYEAGHFNECIQLLTPCVSSIGTRKVYQAYRLLALSYMNMNDDKKAREAAVKLLRLKPDYRLFPYFDPVEFTNLLAQYDVWSKLKVELLFGFNINSVRPIHNYSLTQSEAIFHPEAGYQVGVQGEYFFTKKLSMSVGFMVDGISYTRTADNVSGWNQEFSEKLVYIDVPIAACYSVYRLNSFNVKAELGLGFHFLSSSNSNILLHNPLTGDNIQNSLDQKPQRNPIILSFLPGIVMNYPLGEGMLTGTLSYGIGLNNVVNASKRYDNLNFSMGNQYIDSDIAFNTFYFSLGYQIPLPKLYAVKLKKS